MWWMSLCSSPLTTQNLPPVGCIQSICEVSDITLESYCNDNSSIIQQTEAASVCQRFKSAKIMPLSCSSRVQGSTVVSWYGDFCHQENPLCNSVAKKYGHIALRTKMIWIGSRGLPQGCIIFRSPFWSLLKLMRLDGIPRSSMPFPWFANLDPYNQRTQVLACCFFLKSPSTFENKLLCFQ